MSAILKSLTAKTSPFSSDFDETGFKTRGLWNSLS